MRTLHVLEHAVACSARWLAALAVTVFATPAVATPATAQSSAPPLFHADFEPGPSAGGIQEFRLRKNGLRVLLFPEPASPQITVNVTYLVGSRHENYAERGLAHLLEHMLFKATRKFPNLWQDLQNRGFINNGTTWLDRTNYFERFAASEEHLRWALEMEADRMAHARLLPEELATEMTVVRNEFEMAENRPQWVLYDRTVAAALPWHNYGRSTIGNRSDIEAVSVDALRRFYETYYRPDNAVLLIAGRFDPARALDWVSQYFGEIPRPRRELPAPRTVEPTQDGEREVTVRRVGDAHHLFVVYRTPAATHEDAPALQLFLTMMTLDPSGRLYQALVRSGLAVSVEAQSIATLEPYVMGIWATLNRTQSVERAQEVLLRTIEEAARTPFTALDLERAKLHWERTYDEILADSARFAIALSEAIALGDWRAFFLERDRIARVTLEDIARVAATYFKPQNRTLGRFIATDQPDRVPIPEAPPVARLLDGWSAPPPFAAAEPFDPTPANIEARAKRYRLANGLKVVLWPKRTRGQTVHVVLQRGYGSVLTRHGQAAVEELASATLLRGAFGLTREMINDELSRLRASGALGLGGASFQTRRPYLTRLLELIGRIYAEPSFPEEELELARRELITALEESARDPEAVASEALARHFNRYPRGDIRHARSLSEQIADLRAVTRAQVVEHYERMRGFSAAELVILGDFDESAVRDAIERHFAQASPLPYERITREPFAPPPQRFQIETPDRENASFIARLSFELDDRAADYPALVLANYIIGGSAGSRLFSRLREREGLSYDVSSSLEVPTFDRHATWTFSFTAAPDNAARAEAALRDELAQLLAGALSEAELEAHKRSLLEQRALRRARDAALAQQLATLADAERDFGFVAALEERLAALSKADFDAVVRKYLRLETLSTALAGDFRRSAAPR
ncbi:MAG: insulinase family protein [Casimicrobiaceae bacterium]|nr:insulinase family protein [Casimicrobiaceae bacterium]MDW8311166.1 insulinase family protein [Burkholderiales bacterium]